MNMKQLGRWHKWWLRKFRSNGKKGMVVAGYGGTVQGKALAGLMQRKLISYEMGFESGMACLLITQKGLRAINELEEK